MRRTSRSALILCLASTASLAQISLRDIPFVPLEANCPIGMQATLEKGGNLLATQRLQVILTKWPSFDIVASRITVHGIAPVANRPEPSEITESLDLNRIVDHPRPTASTGNAPQAPTENTLPWLPPLAEPRHRTLQLARLKMVCLGERLHCRQFYRSRIRELCRWHKLARVKWNTLSGLSSSLSLVNSESATLSISL